MNGEAGCVGARYGVLLRWVACVIIPSCGEAVGDCEVDSAPLLTCIVRLCREDVWS